jgi:Tyrosyl-tRNA synthetase
MSKSLGNYIGVDEPASEIFGKLMSISDELMARYYPLLLGRVLPASAHPLEAKKQLALEIVETYYSRAIAKNTLENWNQRFSQKRLADSELPDYSFSGEHADFVSVIADAYLRAFGITKSRTDVRRLIEQGSTQIDGEKIRDPKAKPLLRSGQVLRLDKTRAVRIA